MIVKDKAFWKVAQPLDLIGGSKISKPLAIVAEIHIFITQEQPLIEYKHQKA
jgi:hypothetical protein